jgi:4a-hydroxytetrahydrobiopterin dehydratase
MPKKLTDVEIAKRLEDLTGWLVRKGKLHKKFRFEDFAEAFGFMAACAVVAQGMNHHPEWSNAYNVVDVELTTHDADGISDLDFKLAQRMDALHSAK